ncbi:MAG TPA: hypothetical protein VFL83_16745 [Anaeromyxobacter sp.]|nr:hypothetical protein [Anaeromyxobacter sp.]
MKRTAQRTLAACAALSLACPLTGGLRPAKTRIEGSPSRPAFVFDTTLVLADFTVERWTGEKWTKVWAIENAPSTRVRVRQVEYGTVPDGYSEYVPPKEPTLATNALYKVLYEGGAVRGGTTFAVVERDGKPTVVELDPGKPFADVLAEFDRLVRAR